MFVYRVTKSIAREILQDVINEACRDCVLRYLDDVIETHVTDIEARLQGERFLLDFEDEFLTEIVTDVVKAKNCEEECLQIVQEVIREDLPSVAEEMLIHSGAKIAFSQYKQVAQVIT